MKWIQYKIHTTTFAVDIIGEILYELGIPGFEVSDHIPPSPEEERQMYTDIPAALEPDDGTAVITFYTEGDNSAQEREFYSTGSSLRDDDAPPIPSLPPQEMIHTLQKRIETLQQHTSLAMPEITFSIQDDSLWKDKWKDSFHPFRIADDLVVTPLWEEHPRIATAQDTILRIEPGSAFGTGTHETTRLCLASLRRRITAGASVMDAGCGSGILAIAALLCGAGHVFCLDIDPSAIRSTAENAACNQIDASRIQTFHGNILEDQASIKSLCPEPFDIVVANILADVIIPLTDIIRPFLKSDGIFISSGILRERAEDVRHALTANTFQILEENVDGDWISFTATIS